MITVAGLYNYFDGIIPKNLSEEWDNDGLMVCPDKNAEVDGVLFALDATADAIEYAHNNGYNVIITHHPLIFHKLSELSGDSSTSVLAIKALLYGISILSFHTRLDSVDFGVNNVLAEKIGLDSVVYLDKSHDGGSIGCIGLYKSCNLEEFCVSVKKALKVNALTVAKGCDTINRVAVVGGSGDDYIFSAVSKGADTFITGEVHHHIYILAQSLGVNIIGAGHHATENPVLEILAKKLNDFAEIKHEIYNSDPTFII